ncbi:MAG: beta-ketoacyl-ACP synthase III [Caldilineaceae bacterium]
MATLFGRIAGWGAYTPDRILTNHELGETLDTSDDWIVQRTGIRERHIAAAHETTCSMAVEASRSALAKAGLLPTDLDLIIIATSTPDYFTPPVSSQIQAELGATNVPAFVVVTGCTGFVYSLVVAQQFIATGAYRSILIVGVELLSRFVDWTDRSMCVLFGDAAGAVVVQADTRECGVLGFLLGSDGSHGQHIIMPSGGSARPFNADVLAEGSHYLRMNGREVFKFATRVIGPACDQALHNAGLTMNDVDWIIPHQANLRIIQAAAREMHLPMERFVVNIDRYANTSAASIPLALAEELDGGSILPTDTLLLVSFGAGMTWAAAVVKLRPAAD